MMSEHATRNFGHSGSSDALNLPRAAAVAHHLVAGRAEFAKMVEACRSADGTETVIIDLEVEVPQAPLHDIRPIERIALRFRPVDESFPEALALRTDFPEVPHLILQRDEYPKSLCLYDQPWAELKLRWTAAAFIERVRTWLALTARGELHAGDQPLEPILLAWEHHIVLPADIFEATADGGPGRLYVQLVEGGPGAGVLVARHAGNPRADVRDAKFVATTFKCQPQEHGVIRRTPTNLRELARVIEAAGLDLLTELRRVLVVWREFADIHKAAVILIIWFPKTRAAGAQPESTDVWAFALHKSIDELAPILEAWDTKGGKTPGLILHTGFSADAGSEVGVSLLNPTFTLTRTLAATLNGITPSHLNVTAIGAGALGSQVLMNLVRCGCRVQTIIDHDRLFPHNLSRHGLEGFAIGAPKAVAFAEVAHSILEADAKPRPIVADVLVPGEERAAVADALASAEVILDLSASVPVARAIARDHAGAARRVSAFLSPSGRDVVLLAEDSERTVRLDHLEHQLYRHILTDPALAGHLKRNEGRLRYARSCRDVSSDLPQHLASLHAAIVSHGIREALARPNATIRAWRAGDDLSVQKVDIETLPTIEHEVGGWRVCTDQHFVDRIARLRREKLPNEIGGVLLGSFDLPRRIIYLVDTIPSPPDSKEWPTLYVRGSEGLLAEVNRTSATTGGMLQYVGEWHSHPRGVPPLPSADDCTVFAWLTELMDRDGFPALMLIASDSENVVFVGRMIQGARP